MKMFGFNLSFSRKAAVNVTSDPVGALSPSGGWRRILEPFAGAWQRNIEVDPPQTLLAFSAVYACLSLISADISKLRIKLVEQDDDGIWNEFDSTAFSPVLRKPNRYQTRVQFLSNWMLMKLIYGNTYVLKERDARGVVVAMYVLDSQRVSVLVTKDGAVFYRLNRDDLAGLPDGVTIPASEIIHDRGPCFFHPLVGIPPLFACALAATQGNRIQSNSQQFFDNLSRPGGILSAPGTIPDESIAALKAEFERNFSGSNIGRLLVVGDDMKYTPMAIPAQQAQLIEQLQWTTIDVARAFRVPLHKLATGPNPTFNNIAQLNQDYYSQCLQEHIESIEILLDEGLGLTQVPGVTYGTELDLDGLNRMDPLTTAEVVEKGVKAGYLKPDEARAKFNLAPVPGGNTPYMQVQNTALLALSKVDPSKPPQQSVATPKPPEPVTPAAAPANQDQPPPTKAIEEISDRMQKQLSDAEEAAQQRAADLESMRSLVEEMRDAGEAQKQLQLDLQAESRRIAEEKAELEASDAAFGEFMTALRERLATEDLCG